MTATDPKRTVRVKIIQVGTLIEKSAPIFIFMSFLKRIPSLLLILVVLNPHDSFSSTLSEHCKNPRSLDTVLECRTAFWNDNGRRYEKFGDYGPTWFWYGKQNSCRYLPEAMEYLQKKHNNHAKDFVVVAVMSQLPLSDYVTTWGPAIIEAYNRGAIREEEAIDALLPDRTARGDLYIAWREKAVNHYFNSILEIKKISKYKSNYTNTIENLVAEAISGELARSVLHSTITPTGDSYNSVNLNESCNEYQKDNLSTSTSKKNSNVYKYNEILNLLYTDNSYNLWYQGGDLAHSLVHEEEFLIRVLRNSIYAKHGYRFSDNNLTRFFEMNFPSYKPLTKNIELNETEKGNIEFLKIVEDRAKSQRIN